MWTWTVICKSNVQEEISGGNYHKDRLFTHVQSEQRLVWSSHVFFLFFKLISKRFDLDNVYIKDINLYVLLSWSYSLTILRPEDWRYQKYHTPINVYVNVIFVLTKPLRQITLRQSSTKPKHFCYKVCDTRMSNAERKMLKKHFYTERHWYPQDRGEIVTLFIKFVCLVNNKQTKTRNKNQERKTIRL